MAQSKINDFPALLALACAQTVVWAALFYLFPILLIRWEVDLGLPRDVVAPALTLALIISAVFSPLAGRIVDRGLGGVMMTACGFLGAMGLLALTQVSTPVLFYLCWAVIGLAISGCLYEPCFAFLTRLGAGPSRRRITTVTLVAGFASTLCYPIADLLAGNYGWRVAAVVFATAVILVACPLFYFSTRWFLRHSSQDAPPRDAPREIPPALRNNPFFWVLIVSFPLVGLTHGMIISHIVPILGDRGADATTTIFAASLIGPMQVLGRVVMTTIARGASPQALTMVCFGGIGLSMLILLSARDGGMAIYGFVIIMGASYGILSIARPLVTAALLGRVGFGAISGRLAQLYILASALAPFAAAVLWRWNGYDLVLILGAVSAFLAFIIFTLGSRLIARPV